MHGKEDPEYIILKFDDGEDLMESLKGAISQFRISSGHVISGIGMLRNIEIGYFAGKEKGYSVKTLQEPHELVSLQGSISTAGGAVIHLHCSLANLNHEIVGGHLNSATVCVLNEILIRKTDKTVLGRVHNPKTGLKELTIS